MSIVQGTKARGIELRTINRLLRKLGLVLVIAVETDLDTKLISPTRLWIERSRSYDRRTQAVQA
jgi:hypothetical protein